MVSAVSSPGIDPSFRAARFLLVVWLLVFFLQCRAGGRSFAYYAKWTNVNREGRGGIPRLEESPLWYCASERVSRLVCNKGGLWSASLIATGMLRVLSQLNKTKSGGAGCCSQVVIARLSRYLVFLGETLSLIGTNGRGRRFDGHDVFLERSESADQGWFPFR